MKRERHGSGHAAMFRRKPVKRGDGLGVAEYARDLLAAGDVGGLTLSAGLGLHGSAGNQRAGCADFVGGEQFAVMGGNIAIHAIQHGSAAELAEGGRGGCVSGLRAANVVGAGGNGEGFVVGHFVSPKRADPADEPSSHVTSDTSSPHAKEILNGARA